MLIHQLTYAFATSGALDTFWGKLDDGQDATLGLAASARPLLVAAQFAKNPRATLVVVASEDGSIAFARNLAVYLGEERILRFPALPFTRSADRIRDAKLTAQRMRAAWALQKGLECMVVTSAAALIRRLAPSDANCARPLVLTASEELSAMSGQKIADFDAFLGALVEKGYENTGELEGQGTFCTRGGVVDVFPGNLVYPVRLDFFGDELEEIRRIVPTTGQTISSLDTVEIFPVSAFPCTEGNLARVREKLEKPALLNPAVRETMANLEGGLRFAGAEELLPYLFKRTETICDYARDGSLVSLIEPRSLFDDAQHAYDEAKSRATASAVPVDDLVFAPTELDFGKSQRATYVSIMRVGASIDDELPVKRTDVAGDEEKLYGRLRLAVDDRSTLVFSVPNYRAREEMKLELVDRGLPIHERLETAEPFSEVSRQLRARLAQRRDDAPKRHGAMKPEPNARQAFAPLERGLVHIVDNDIPLGMIFPKAKVALIALADAQGVRKATPTARDVDITAITFPYKPGDYVVHAAHGIAYFSGLVRQEVDGTLRDYLLLEYAEGDKLYVPVEQLDRVTRYVGPDGSNPRLTRLNTSDWSRAIAKARKATKKMAFDLIDVYARRAATQGFRFSPDTLWQKEMEEAFPFQETPDQLAAIADVKADMQSLRPMDRLICGDVGFGKTEVALRAAFKATQDNKQVMVLCPTTILAQQHYTSFLERFEPFGVRVEVLSRFRTAVQQAEALAGFAEGDVQVLIGTHRLLSRDVNPHDLGLVIIDEEQRFGVGHKEQLKNLRESIDVLTLSATPIPRTMQMALSGVRDMSLILTPPDDRLPVKVHVGEWDPDVVSDAIRYELARGGQVYYVSNRVRTIDDAVERVRAAAGEARIGVAHGKMSREDLERVMEDFSAGMLDVLVATTIIESGIDNPHTNTLIIEDAQRLGLAQMYQLKGRVGRSSTQAYAYFMFPDNAALSEEAWARLTALDEHQDLGSGMRIALRDLEIRGAGSLLGAEQHGNMSAVGFDLFAQMLAQAVNNTREGATDGAPALPPALSDITVNIPGHAYFPDDYLPDVDERVMWYRRIASAATREAVDAIERELAALHPELPPAAENLLKKARIKAFANERGIKLISVAVGRLVVEPIALSREKLSKLRKVAARYTADKRRLAVPLRQLSSEKDDVLGVVEAFLKDLDALVMQGSS